MEDRERSSQEQKFVSINSELEDIGAQLKFIAESIFFMDEGPFAIEPGDGSLRGLYCIIRDVEGRAEKLLEAVSQPADMEAEAAA
jgi:hypothetical protein